MGCLTATERVQFPLLSRSNPGRYVKDVEVDTDEDETPACTPPARPRAEEEPRAARVPRKRKWNGEAEQSQQDVVAASSKSRAIQELSCCPKEKARRLVLTASSADTRRAAEKRNSPSLEEDVLRLLASAVRRPDFWSRAFGAGEEWGGALGSEDFGSDAFGGSAFGADPT
ncbi:hypothetical protein AXG93_3671s1100 [Marchantia polymorpha subsp. ruderalis]|uniref:Uncharacterized protein n=1 Tax=Marchantia polymorpha subsp. ruderalis TaxID=1480154 RepID=A0A176WIH0_MARPO|nr:hypothetical protein AXG93_3671s1100 [Marchantia polymorpha subsp. ruderalis]